MPAEYHSQRIRDPLHDIIDFSPTEFENVLWAVINTAPFQRLRRIRQLGFSDLVFPGATHSRFAHCVGVFHTARMLMKIIKKYLQRNKHYSEAKAQVALAAALVHDVGHGPFSHSFEAVGHRLGLKLADHEKVSDALIRHGEIAEALAPLGSGFADDVANLISGKGEKHIYGSVVSSQFDADRLDYMRRDRLMTGTQHGAIDFSWLLANLEVGEIPLVEDDRKVADIETFVLGPKAIHAAESYVLGLFQLYPTVYFHKTTRSAEKLFTELFVRIITLAKDGSVEQTGLAPSHPIVRLALDPGSVESVLALDDAVIWGALHFLAVAKDSAISNFARRLRDRKLFKAIDIRERVRIKLQKSETADSTSARPPPEAVDRACASIRLKLEDLRSGAAGSTPAILLDEGERSPYKDFQESKGPLNQIHIRTRDAGLVDIKARSDVVAAIEPFRFFRAYTAPEDGSSKEIILKLIEEETGHA